MGHNEESKAALKATGVVGGGQIINIAIGLVKTKVIAIILGPSGVGIVGILTTAIDMVRNISGFGLSFSGVREISIADSKGDSKEISKITSIYIKWLVLSAILGGMLMLVFCIPLSQFLFGNSNYAMGIAFLSLAVFFTSISLGLAAVMQGKRAIGLMVKSGILSNIAAAMITIVVYFFLEDKGIVLATVLASIVNCLVVYYYYKKMDLPPYIKIPLKKSWVDARAMISVGFFTIVVSLFDQAMSLGLRAFISEKAGISGVGLFTAAYTIANMYLTIVLTSLGSDYYPKLAAIHHNNLELKKSVNTQLFIIILLASPIIIGMIGFNDLVIKLLYSSEFLGAQDVLKWYIVGDFFKIISWPCGYVFLAKGLGKLYISYSVSYTILYFTIIYFGWDYFGFFGVGISFFISQLAALVFTYWYSFLKYKIAISNENIKIIGLISVFLILSFCSHQFFTGYPKFIFSGIIFLSSLLFSLVKLSSVVDIKGFLIRKLNKN